LAHFIEKQLYLKLEITKYERGMGGSFVAPKSPSRPTQELPNRVQNHFPAPKLDPRGTRNYYISSSYNAACHISLFQISDAIVFPLLFSCGARYKMSVLELPYFSSTGRLGGLNAPALTFIGPRFTGAILIQLWFISDFQISMIFEFAKG